MDIPIILPVLPAALWIFIPFLILVYFLKSPMGKGMIGEFIINLMVKIYLDKKKYHLVRNVTLPTESGTTQIDHIIVSSYGVFVVETKNMKGWIFGTENQKNWTQKIYKYSVSFQNPLRQNYKHTKVLASLLKIDHGEIFSLIVFIGTSEFKTKMPGNVTSGKGYIRFILSKREILYSRSEVERIIRDIGEKRLKANFKTHKQHLDHLKFLHSEAPKRENRSVDPNTDDGKEALRREPSRGFPGYRGDLTKILVKSIRGDRKQDSRFWQSEFDSDRNMREANYTQPNKFLKNLKILGVLCFICLFGFIAYTSISMVTHPGISRKNKILLVPSIGRVDKTKFDNDSKVSSPVSNLNNLANISSEHNFSKSQIERSKKDLLKKSNRQGLSHKSINDLTVSNQTKYIYEIEMISGARITVDNVSVSNGKVTYATDRGLVVSINSSEVKSVNRQKMPY